MGKKFEAVVAGLTCLDITPAFSNEKADEIGEILIPSKTVLVGKADIHPGGCVSNTGLAMCKFGIKTKLFGKIGNDDFGRNILNAYKEYTTTENMIVSESENTSYSVVVAPKGIDRIFLHYPGTNDTFGIDDIDFELIKEAKLFHYGYPTAMRRMYLNEGKELIQMYRRVKELGVTTSMDTGGIDEKAEVGRENWREIIRKVVPYLDIFVPSVDELMFMLDREKFWEWKRKAGGNDLASILKPEDAAGLAETLLDWGARVVMIKCGSLGIYFATADQKTLEDCGEDLRPLLSGWADVRHFEPSFRPEIILSATGAGDTCIAGFLSAILKEYPWQKCIQYAAATGAVSLEAYDALGGLKSFEELDQKMKDGWERTV